MNYNFYTPHGLKVRLDTRFFLHKLENVNGAGSVYANEDDVLSNWSMWIEQRFSLPKMLAYYISIVLMFFTPASETLLDIVSICRILFAFLFGLMLSYEKPLTILSVAIFIASFPYYILSLPFVRTAVLLALAFISHRFDVFIAFIIATAIGSIISLLVNYIFTLNITKNKYGIALNDVEVIAFKVWSFLYLDGQTSGNKLMGEYAEYVRQNYDKFDPKADQPKSLSYKLDLKQMLSNKRNLITAVIIVLIAISIIAAVSYNIGKSQGEGEKEQAYDEYGQYEDEYDPKMTVWVGQTGSKFHREDCPTLSGRKRSMTLEDALALGREPCKVCFGSFSKNDDTDIYATDDNNNTISYNNYVADNNNNTINTGSEATTKEAEPVTTVDIHSEEGQTALTAKDKEILERLDAVNKRLDEKYGLDSHERYVGQLDKQREEQRKEKFKAWNDIITRNSNHSSQTK